MSKTHRLGRALHDLDSHVGNFSVEALATQVPASMVSEILALTDKASKRVRDLPADLVVYLVIALGLWRSLSIPNVYKRLRDGFRGRLRLKKKHRPPFNPAFTQARDRLGERPLRLLFRRMAAFLSRKFAPLHLWKGLIVLAIDGTTAKAPDSPANRRTFGAPRSHRGKSGYPFVRIVGLIAAYSHLVLAAAVAGWSTGENPLTLQILPSIPSGALVLLDRGFFSYRLLWGILGRKSHFLIRLRKRLRIRKLKRLGPGDWIARGLVPAALRRKNPDLPPDLLVRLIHYRVAGFRPSTLVTSLLDPDAFPAAELVLRYHDRWEIELAYDESKTHMASTPVLFRSQTPERVRQEAWGLLIAYNLVRAVMAQAAQNADLSPLRLSFVDSLQCVLRYIGLMAQASFYELPELYRALLREVAACLLPPRRHRRNPRAVKVKMSSFPLKRSRHAS